MSIQLTPSQMNAYRKSARERENSRRKLLDDRRQHAWNIANKAASILKVEYGAERVVVFGSLVHPELFHLRSDIDLAVWGIKDYFRAVSRLLDIDPDIDFDLVPIEDAGPGVLSAIENEGLDL
jgi:predicted nucleotidyltransferase